MASETQTVTIRVPEGIYHEFRTIALHERVSVNALIVESVKDHLAAIRRAEIDASFAGMATDPWYQELCKEIK
jgi:hypothetical protein